MSNDPERSTPPRSVVAPVRRSSWLWLVPSAAALLAGWFAWNAWGVRGTTITVRAEHGYGIRAGDALRYRGIAVGGVVEVHLSPALDEVVMRVRLNPGAESLARAGSRFWVVRPHVSLDGVQGLETLIGARNLAVLPGSPGGRPRDEFIAISQAPVNNSGEQGGLEIVLEAQRRSGLAAGAPLTYREIQVGVVLSVGLSSDATSVELRVLVRAPYVQLIREGTQFWEAGGLEVSLSMMEGVTVEMDSLRSLVVGGVALATPTEPGLAVRTGYRYALHRAPEDEWLEWRPALPLGNAWLSKGVALPRPVRAQLSWKSGRLIETTKRGQGWVLPVTGGLLGPRDLLVAPEDASDGTISLEMEGQRIVPGLPVWEGGGLARIALGSDTLRGAPRHEPKLARRPGEPEDCLVIGDSAAAPLALAAARLSPADGGWAVDPALPLGDDWHGASVVARSDGRLVGVLLVEDGAGRVAPPVPEN